MQCEICGTEYAKKRAVIAGSELVVCDSCAKYGKQVDDKPKIVIRSVESFPGEPPALKESYGAIVRKAREAKGMTVDELAQAIFENHSWLKKVEQNRAKPDSKLISKLEKVLSVKLTGE
jgi:putative transcription factor